MEEFIDMRRTRSLEATRRRGILSIIIITLLLQPFSAAQSRSFFGRVVSVSDGDTLTVLDRAYREHKIRLIGIDAPEGGQDFGQASRMNLARMIFGREVLVIVMATDKYDRALAKVFVDETDVNTEQVRAGMAWFYRAFERDIPPPERQLLDNLERDARAEKRGLWQHRNPMPPWEFRERKRGENAPAAVPSSIWIIGNRNSGIYHRSDCPDFNRVSERNRVPFRTEDEAKKAGYKKARNCP